MGFHAPQEATRILGESINFSRQGQNAVRGSAAGESTGAKKKAAYRDQSQDTGYVMSA